MGESKQYQLKYSDKLVLLTKEDVSKSYFYWRQYSKDGTNSWPAYLKFIGAGIAFDDQMALPRIAKRVKLLSTPHGYTLLRARAIKRKVRR